MLVFPRYSHHSLSWKLVAHSQTSYGMLMFLVLILGVAMVGMSWGAQAANDCGVPSTDKCSGSYSVMAVVPGPRPTKPATITSPANGQVFTTNPLTITGTCPAKTLVKVFSNGVLVGSLLCPANGQFSIPIDLIIGKNELTALAYNALDQAGPASPTITVTLDQPGGGLGFSSELILQSSNFYRGSEPGQAVVWPIVIVGGQAPYAVSVDWGDGTTEIIARSAPGPFTVTHKYQKKGGYLGSYPLIIRAADAAGHVAYLQLTTIVNSSKGGVATAAANSNTTANALTSFPYLWPVWILLLFMVTSFWLGERREKKIMVKQLEALA